MPVKPLAVKTLDEVVLSYYHGHAVNVRAGTRIKYQLGHVVDFFNGMTIEQATKPQTITAFCDGLLKGGMKPNTANNVLTIIKAAINRSYKLGEIPSAPYIALLPAQAAAPKGRPLKVEEIGALLAAAHGHTHVFMMMCMGTGARPEALCELTWPQVDFDAGLIELNPEGRQQTSKFRPTIKLPPALGEYLKQVQRTGPYVISWRGGPTRRYFEAWQRAKESAGLEGTITPYSYRHTAARWMRQQGVPPWEVAAQLGHSAGARLNITERYAAHAPDYLEKACAALDKLILQAIACERRENEKRKAA